MEILLNNNEMNHKTESYLDKYPLYKRNESDTIYWVDVYDKKGEFVFTFDKIHVFNLFKDYPQSLTEEQKIIFDKENPYWADFLKKNNRYMTSYIDTELMCSYLKKKLFEEDGAYHHIWLAIQDDPEVAYTLRNRQLLIYRFDQKVLCLAGKAEPKIYIEDDPLVQML